MDRCTNFMDKYTKLASANDIEEILQQKIVSFTVDEQVEASVGLCKEYCNALYTCLHPLLQSETTCRSNIQYTPPIPSGNSQHIPQGQVHSPQRV